MWSISIALTILALFFAAAPAAAQTTLANDGHFELGPGACAVENNLTNILGCGTLNGPDWSDIFDANGAVRQTCGPNNDQPCLFGGQAARFLRDDVSAGSANDITVYSGGPSDKNNDLIDEWTWTTSSVPAKDDITNCYAYAKIVNSALRIYAGCERLDESGASHIDLEFNQDAIALDATPPCTAGNCGFTGVKRVGDIVISMNFRNGGALGDLTLFRWSGTQYVQIAQLGQEGCNQNPITVGSGQNQYTIPAGKICAFNNGGIIDGGPWPNFGKSGQPVATLLTNAFTEFGVDINALLNVTTAPCFATFQVHTRSSPSFTATLKDLAIGSFESCTAGVDTIIRRNSDNADVTNTTNVLLVNQTVHDTAIVTGTPGFAAPTGTVTFKRFANGTCSGTPVQTYSPVNLSTGTYDAATNSVTVSSPDFTPTQAGSFSYLADFNSGDSNYPSVLGDPLTDCEPVAAIQLNSQAVTAIHWVQNGVEGTTDIQGQTVYVGTVVIDVVTVTGPAGGPTPSGSVTFRRYSDAAVCAGDTTGSAGSLLTSTTLDGTGVAKSATVTTTVPSGSTASLVFRAFYAGDTLYTPSVAACEPLTVRKFDATITTVIHNASHQNILNTVQNLGASSTIPVHDQATVTVTAPPAGSIVPDTTPVPGGNVGFTRYPSGDCTGTGVLDSGTLNGSGVAESSVFNLGAQTASYRASYNGDANFNPIATESGCEPVCALKFLTQP